MADQVLDHLIEVSHEQSSNMDKMIDAISDLNKEIEQRPTRKNVYKIMGLVGVITIGMILFLSYLAYHSSVDSLRQLNDCIDPSGECAKQGAANSTQIRGQIVCNEEKVLYFVAPKSYKPLPFCIDVINSEIDRGAGGLPKGTIPKLPVPKDVTQVVPLKDTFKVNK